MNNFETWITEMSLKLQQQGKTLEEVLFDESLDLIQGNYQIDEEARKNYKTAIEMVMSWFLQGKCFFKFDDMNKPYYVHTISIKWRTEEDDVEIPAKELYRLCGKLNGSLLIGEKGEWQLSTVIYKENRS